MALTPEQLKERQHYIGGSDVSTVLGRNPYKTPLELYFEKVNGKIEQEDNPYLENGNDGETKNRKKFAKITGLRVETVNSAKHHPEYKFLAANVDGLIYGDSKKQQKQNAESPIAILEVKCVGFRGRKNWGAPVPIPELEMAQKYQSPHNRYGFEQQDGEIPESYLYQALLYAAIYELPAVYFAVDFGMDQYLCTYKYERDIELEKLVIDQLIHFWTENVQKQIPPEAKSIDDIKMLYPQAKEKTQITATTEIEDDFFKAKNLKNQIDTLTSELSTLKTKMAKYMGENYSLLDNSGNKLARFNNIKARGKFDRAKLLEADKETHDKYWDAGDPDKTIRTFVPYFK